MTPLRVLVLEDEWLARKYLAQLIEATGLARVVSAVASLGEAKRFLTENQVDIVFLDVQLAGGENGLDLIGSIPPDVKRPAFVLATAYTQYARKAGDLGAVDSLLKPFSEERVEQCLRRLIHPSGTASPR